MKKLYTILFAILFTAHCSLFTVHCFSQGTAINHSGAPADPSAMLDISSTNQGLLIPRMTTAQRNAIPSPAKGLLIYNTSTDRFNYYKATGWYELAYTFLSPATGTLNPGGGNAINLTGAPADPSAILDVSSTTRGLLVPRTYSDSITSPAKGLIVFDNAANHFMYYNGTQWKTLCETFITSVTGTGSLSSVGVAFNLTGNTADASSMLDISGFKKGLLIPGMTAAERDLILPKQGLMVYENAVTNTIDYSYYDNAGSSFNWYKLESDVPVIPGSINGLNAVCGGQTDIVYTCSVIPGASSYVWTVPNGWTITSGAGTNSIKVTAGNIGQDGTITVKAVNACGMSASSIFNVTVESALPPPPLAGSNTVTQTQIIWNWNTSNRAKGYKWSTSNNYNSATETSPVGATTVTQAGLTCNTTYTIYVWAYNDCGVSSVTTLTQTTSPCGFSCTGTMTDSRDSQVYPIVQIGPQCWMAKNLNYGTYITVGTSGSGTKQNAAGTQKYCANSSNANDATCPYGGLYEWGELMDGVTKNNVNAVSCNGNCPDPDGLCDGTGEYQACSPLVQGICPSGWHVPSHYEWTLLEKHAGSSPTAFKYEFDINGWFGTNEGDNLKATTGWTLSPYIDHGTNTTGFTALPGGRSHNGTFTYAGPGANGTAYFWTTTEYYLFTSFSWVRLLDTGISAIDRLYYTKDDGYSVRCVKD